MTPPALKVWKRDQSVGVLGIHCASCDQPFELADRQTKRIEDGFVVVVPCSKCGDSPYVELAAIGGYLWTSVPDAVASRGPTSHI